MIKKAATIPETDADKLAFISPYSVFRSPYSFRIRGLFKLQFDSPFYMRIIKHKTPDLFRHGVSISFSWHHPYTKGSDRMLTFWRCPVWIQFFFVPNTLKSQETYCIDNHLKGSVSVKNSGCSLTGRHKWDRLPEIFAIGMCTFQPMFNGLSRSANRLLCTCYA